MSLILLCLLIGSFFIQSILFLWLFNRVKPNAINQSDHKPSVSLIIPVRNEVDNIQDHIEHWMSQDYANYEVIIVDDHSTDDLTPLVSSYQDQYPKLRTVQNLDDPGKKAALTTGISMAQGEWIITTDADCKPNNNRWISDIMSSTADHDVILLYGPYDNKPGFLNKFIRYETWFIAMQYLSFAQEGMPYMGVGRNLAYKKKVFQENAGFEKHSHIKSGDDDLFISGLDSSYNIGTNIKALTYSKPKTSFIGLLQQKRRHLSTATAYPLSIQMLLGVLFVSHLTIYGSAICLIILNQFIDIAVITLLLRWTILMYIAQKKMNLLQERSLWYWSPLLDVTLLLYYCLMAVMMPIKKRSW